MSEVIRIGVDLSKSVYSLYGVDSEERCLLKKTLKRNQWDGLLLSLKLRRLSARMVVLKQPFED